MSESSKIFQYLRPVCVEITKDPSISNLRNCIEAIKCLENGSINEGALLEYLIFPYKLTLQKSKQLKEEQEILCFDSLKLIYEKCQSQLLSQDIMLWNLNMVSFYFGSVEIKKTNTETAKTIKLTEEQQYALISLLEIVSCRVNLNVYENIYSKEKYLPILGHLVTILLDILLNEKLKMLQRSAVKCLMYLSGITFTVDIQRKVFGEVFSSFLPGIASKVKNVLSKDQNYGHHILASVIELFTYIVCIVTYDHYETPTQSSCNLQSLFNKTALHQLEDASTQSTKDRPKSLKIKQSKQWLTIACNNLCIIVKEIFSVLLCNANVKVQLSLLNLTETFFKNCFHNLREIIPDCLDLLAHFLCSPFEDVSSRASAIMLTANKQFIEQGNNEIKSILDEKLYSLILSLPRVINSINDDLKIATLRIFKGYIQFYGILLDHVMNSSVHMERLIDSLLQILELDTKDTKYVEEHTINITNALESCESNKNFYTKRFKHFTNQKIYELIEDIIECLSVHCDIDVIIDYLIETCYHSKILRKQCVLLINQFVLNYDRKEGFEFKPLIDLLISAYLEDELFKQPISNNAILQLQQQRMKMEAITWSESNIKPNRNTLCLDTISFEAINSNIQLTCLLIEGISVFAKLLKTGFNFYLMQVLYPLLEKVGSTNTSIHLTALDCLHKVVKHCGYVDITDLIITNSDYLLNAITLDFRRFTSDSATSAVLCVILQFCTKDLMPVIADAIEDVFKNLDRYQDEVADKMLNVLKFLATAVSKWYINGNKVNEIEKQNTKLSSAADCIFNNDVSVAHFMLNYFDTFNLAIGNTVEEVESQQPNENLKKDFVEENENEENIKKETPLQYLVMIKALERCVYFIASNSTSIKIKALDVTKFAVLALQEEENDLLPLLHKLWPVVVKQLKNKDQICVWKTLDVVSIMIKHSSDFLSKRISGEFIGYAIEFLKSNYKLLTPEKSMYTQIHKTISKLIEFLGEVLPVLKIKKELLCDVASVCLLYIDSRLHDSIQKVAVCTLKKMYSYDSNALWILLKINWREPSTQPPIKIWKELHFIKNPNVYMKDNVNKILSSG